MNIKSAFLVCVTAWAVSSCSPKVTSNVIRRMDPQPRIEDVVMLKEKEPLPADAQWMGTVEVQGSGNYEKFAEITRTKAWTEGAKYVKVNSYGSPGVRSDIHVMNSSLYWADQAKVNDGDIKVIDREGNVISAYNAASGTPNATYAINVPLTNLGFNSFRFYGGYGRRVDKVDPSLDLFMKQHAKRLMNGTIIGAEYIRYFDKHTDGGLGIRYQIMHSTSSDAASMPLNDGSYENGILNDKVNITFIGPIFAGRMVSRNGKHLFADNVGLGLLLYSNEETFNDVYMRLTGNTLGWTFDFNYSYFLSDHFTLGADLTYTAGTIRRATITDGRKTETGDLDKNHYVGLRHIGVCAQLVYTF